MFILQGSALADLRYGGRFYGTCCHSERIINIGQYLPKLCSNKKGSSFFDSQYSLFQHRPNVLQHLKSLKIFSFFNIYSFSCYYQCKSLHSECRLPALGLICWYLDQHLYGVSDLTWCELAHCGSLRHIDVGL